MKYKIRSIALLSFFSLFLHGCAKDPQNDRVVDKQASAQVNEDQKSVYGNAEVDERAKDNDSKFENEDKTKPEKNAMMPTHQIYVEGKGEGLSAEVRLNDIPVGTISSNGMPYASHAEFSLLPGENTVTLRPDGDSGSVYVRVASYPLNAPVDGQGGDTLIEITADLNEPVKGRFSLSEERPSWSWVDADDVGNDEGYKSALEFSKNFYKILQTGNMDKILPVLQPVHTDMSKLSPDVSVEVRNQESTEGMENRISKPIWQFDKLEDIEFDAIPIANGKLYLIQRKDGSELFRTSQESRFERYTFYKVIGRKNGQWAFYR